MLLGMKRADTWKDIGNVARGLVAKLRAAREPNRKAIAPEDATARCSAFQPRGDAKSGHRSTARTGEATLGPTPPPPRFPTGDHGDTF